MTENIRRCRIDGCERRHVGLGLCKKHYGRFKSTGDPCKTMVAEKGEPQNYYKNTVLAYDGITCLIWPYSRNTNGRGQFIVDGRLSQVHRVLCEEVKGAPPTSKHEAAHSCGNGHEGCVTKSHLSWKTASENAADRLIHGTHTRGERCGRATLSNTQAKEILALKGLEKIGDTAARYGVRSSLISSVQCQRTWKWLSSETAA